MSLRRFLVLLRGLSDKSRWRAWAAEEPEVIEGEDVSRALKRL